jgi:HK97 family phage prohead protease
MPEVTTNYVRIPVRNRTATDKIRTITISNSQGIKALYSINRKVVLTYLFARSKGWTMAKAKAWIAAHKSLAEEQDMIKKSEDSKLQRFEFQIPVLKAQQVVELDADGNEFIARYVEGVASTTDKDLQGDRMAPEAIESMADSIKRHVILLNAEHDRSWQSELGEVVNLEVDNAFNLMLKAKLDKTSKAEDLWYALTEKQKKLGLSIGGYVKDVELVQEKDEEGGDTWVRVYKDIELDHVAVVSSPANPKTWVSVIAKSLDETKMEDIESENMDKKNVPLEAEDVRKDEPTSPEPTLEPSEEVQPATPDNGESVEPIKEEPKEEPTSPSEEAVVEEPAKPAEEIKVEEPAEEPKIEEADEGSEDKLKEEVVGEEPPKEEETPKAEEAPKEETKEETPVVEPEVVEPVKEDSEPEVEVSEAKAKEEDTSEVTKALSSLLSKVDEVLNGQSALTKQIEVLDKRVNELEEQPVGRKTAIEKGLGEEDESEGGSKEAMDKEIADLRRDNPTDPNLFAKIQKIRLKYGV